MTSFFTGKGDEHFDRAKAHDVAFRLSRENAKLDYGLAWSAVSYLLRDGQPTNDSRVLTEARRRKALLNRAVQHRPEARSAA